MLRLGRDLRGIGWRPLRGGSGWVLVGGCAHVGMSRVDVDLRRNGDVARHFWRTCTMYPKEYEMK